MAEERKNPLSRIKAGNIIYPILIGLIVLGYLFWRDFDGGVLADLHFNWDTVLWCLLALFCMLGRDLGYMIRIRVLSNYQLSWLQSFRIVMLWEFTSAVTPSAVGGTGVAVIYIHKEGLSVGRSSTIVMLTSFLDELYFIVVFPLVLLIVGPQRIFDVAGATGAVVKSLITFALIGYTLKLAWLILLSYGLFFNPRGVQRLLATIFRLRPLRRWYRAAVRAGGEIVLASREMYCYKPAFWWKAAAATFLSWSSRYLVANALIMAFFSVTDHLLLFARQLVMWIMMLVMPTPGGSGFAEYLFTTYCSDLIDVPVGVQLAAAALIAALWRLVTYYPYLIAGAIIFPRWLKRNFSKRAIFRDSVSS